MQGIQRKIVHASVYELIGACIVAPAISLFCGAGFSRSGLLAVMISAIAISWNILFNYGFDFFTSRAGVTERKTGLRILHAVLFEGALAIGLAPLIAYVLDMSLNAAIAVDVALLAFYSSYAFVYNIIFDKLFGLPSNLNASGN